MFYKNLKLEPSNYKHFQCIDEIKSVGPHDSYSRKFRKMA